MSVSLPHANTHFLTGSRPPSPPSIQGPDPLPGGRSALHQGLCHRAMKGVWGPASSPDGFPGEEKAALPPPLLPRLSRSRRGCGKEEGQSREGGGRGEEACTDGRRLERHF